MISLTGSLAQALPCRLGLFPPLLSFSLCLFTCVRAYVYTHTHTCLHVGAHMHMESGHAAQVLNPRLVPNGHVRLQARGALTAALRPRLRLPVTPCWAWGCPALASVLLR